MKKLSAIICLFLSLSVLGGCSLFLGGSNRREMGEFVSAYTDGDNDFIEQPLIFDDCIVKSGAQGYSLIKEATFDQLNLSEKSSAKLVFQAYITALSQGAFCEEGFEYLYEAVDSAFSISDDETFCEIVLLERDDEIYGAVNFYSRPSGRSGSLLSNEDLIKSVFVNFTDGEIVIVKELFKTAILAFDKTNLIIYKDKEIFTLNTQSGEEVFILKDLWWDKGPTYYNHLEVRFTDDTFLIYGNDDDGVNHMESLFAGNFGSKEIITLMDNEKAIY